ncbi:hypothetical protein NPIL_519851 [Nephila pilipes]|uniref:Uncharacterized protein n=1 Tax=Nephila pilipes TaxID=299642 RepID=A0A8X6NQK9_NEPPI|nr:hypothetical protein NPIL_519851 [Nephila pilipes]
MPIKAGSIKRKICILFGPISENCNLKPQCLNCVGPHRTEDCPIKRMEEKYFISLPGICHFGKAAPNTPNRKKKRNKTSNEDLKTPNYSQRNTSSIPFNCAQAASTGANLPHTSNDTSEFKDFVTDTKELIYLIKNCIPNLNLHPKQKKKSQLHN